MDLGFLLIMFAVIIAIVFLTLLAYDYFCHQRRFFVGREYRRKFGKFSVDNYVKQSDPIKVSDWLRQENNGIKPELYNGKAKYSSFPENIECIVPKKG